MLRVLFCGTGWLPIVDAIAQRLGSTAEVEIWSRSQPLEEAILGIDVLLPSNARIEAAHLRAADRLRLVQQPATGVDGIDVVAAKALGIPVCNAPGGNHRTVAETALFLMLALARRWNEARQRFAEAALGVPLGIELRGRTLGLVGTGRSATELSQIALALGMKVVAINSRSSAAEATALWAASDFVSLHCPLTEQTRGLIDDGVFAAMKNGAYLINCARGPIVDRQALESALQRGTLGGLGLDTYWEEPWDPGDPLYADPRVVTLPHVAGSSEESFAAIATMVVDNIVRLQRGAPLAHRIW